MTTDFCWGWKNVNISPGPSPQISALPLGVGQIPRFYFHSTGAGPRLVMAAYHSRAVMGRSGKQRARETGEKEDRQKGCSLPNSVPTATGKGCVNALSGLC